MLTQVQLQKKREKRELKRKKIRALKNCLGPIEFYKRMEKR